MTRRHWTGALAAAGLVTLGALVAVQYPQHAMFPAHAAPATSAAPAGVPVRELPDFAAIVKQYGPSVVNISASGTRKVGPDDNSSGDDPFSQFFRGLPQFRAPRGEVPMQGLGSGVIVGADGTILTNAHLVRDASEVTVKLTDRREFRAKVLGMDASTDIAVLRIDAKDLPVVRLGNPAKSQVGDWVLAIGSPFGFENSVTAGIISAKGRSLPGEAYVPFLQTDVALNPGNSGGPLFNLQGEVIGINSQIYSRSGGYQGLSFAIPIDVAQRVRDQIVATGRATHAQLGVSIQQVNQSLAESFGLKRAEGALISFVQPGSPAERAGLKTGDIVLKYNGQPIPVASDLPSLVGMASPGEKAKLEVWRKGEARELVATLGAAQAEAAKSAKSAAREKLPSGLAVRPLTPRERSEAKVPQGGLLVERVDAAAARAGIQPGDIVLSANGTPVNSAADLQAAAKSKKTVALLVQRGDARVFLPVPIG
jgi:serine protease Do